MNYFVIGDIHGSSAQLDVLLRHQELFEGRRIIFLGDYVDIGPNSNLVINTGQWNVHAAFSSSRISA
jgi:predicted phosphodiesterase